MRVVTWNLMHGRSVGGRERSRRDLLPDFADALAGWEWDVALLQEVPPWWPAALGAQLRAEYRIVLTSRNALLWVRRAIAVRWPDAIKSNGGGATAILARRDRIFSDRAMRLCRLPERRWAHGVQLGCGAWIVNLHATAGRPAAAERDCAVALASARTWAGSEPLVFGGDLNLRRPTFPGLRAVASRDVDHLFVAGLAARGDAEVLDAGPLSDHPPLVVTLSA
ncbi:MAG: endonuclease/exonuclease/phosphatase family protein [Solirubrobacteraceae bacterium]